jgi:hypothetical protein
MEEHFFMKSVPLGDNSLWVFLGATPDAVLDELSICEVKVPYGSMYKKVSPDHYLQMQCSMFISDQDVCYYVVFRP